MSAAQPLLSAAVRQLSRSAYGAVVKPARGFQVFRIDGYSWSKTLPAGECVSSGPFAVGGRSWQIDYYPNGTDRAMDSDTDSISVYLRILPLHYQKKERVRAQYKFSLLDPSGIAAYELPAETGVVVRPTASHGNDATEEDAVCARVGLADFIAKEELERRRETLLRDDCLAIRCDVGVTELDAIIVAPKENHSGGRSYDDGDDYSDWEEGGGGGNRRRHVAAAGSSS